MSLKKTHLLPDDPAQADEFGPHSKIATLITDEIANSSEGRSIALIGDWGSGKSTVLKLIEEALKKLKSSKSIDARVFSYDAWSHQGDPLRRSFLDDLVSFLKQESLISADEAQRATDRIWNRQEVTTVTVEPIARKHAFLLLLSLAAVPLGYKLLEVSSNQSLSDAILSGRNILALLLMLAPLPLVAIFAFVNKFGPEALRKFLFGVSEDDRNFSVLSFFFQKTQGTSERKLVKTPADSIIEFKRIFNYILDNALYSHPEARLVIIIDNIDRIPSDHAKEFWSTMQTFFAEDGGPKKTHTRTYWLIAPFSLRALAFIFKDTAEGAKETSEAQKENVGDEKSKAKGYVDKTFGMSLTVPPPILADWRKYLLKQLKTAFPEHEEDELVAVRDVYGVKILPNTLVMPRSLKLFVNDLVVLYRQRGTDVSLPLMAAFILNRDNIQTNGFPTNILSTQELRIIDEIGWRAKLAALYYGVSADIGNQILLQEPINQAIAKSDALGLQRLEGQPGFEDVLFNVVRSELDTLKNGEALCRIAATLDLLQSANSATLKSLWRQVCRRLRAVSVWGYTYPIAPGLRAIFAHSPPAEIQTVVDAVAKILSEGDPGEPSEKGPWPEPLVANWVEAAIATIQTKAQKPPTLAIPGTAKFVLEVLQQLAASKTSETVKSAFTVSAPAELVLAIANDISSGRPIREPELFVSLATRLLKAKLSWGQIVQAAVTRLRVDPLPSAEGRSLAILLIAASTIAKEKSGMVSLRELSMQGVLSNVLNSNLKNKEGSAALVLANLLSNPKFERSAHVGQSPTGDNFYNEQTTKRPKFDNELVGFMADLIVKLDGTRRLFEIGAQNENASAICAAIIDAIVKKRAPLDIDPDLVIQNRRFFETQSEYLETGAFLGGIADSVKILAKLSEQAFEIDKCRTYRAALDVPAGTEQFDSYKSFLKDRIHALPETEWDQALNAASGPYLDLVALASDLKKREHTFELSFSTRDALHEQIKKIAQGKISTSPQVKDTFNALLNLIPIQQQRSLFSDVMDDLLAASDSGATQHTVEFIGDKLTGTIVTDIDPDRLIRRLFSPTLTEGGWKTMVWMADLLASFPEIYSKANREKAEFALRLRTAAELAAGDEKKSVLIKRLAETLHINFAPTVDAGSSADKEPKFQR